MGKDLDLIQAVKEQDIGSLQKLLQKAGRLHNKNKLIGNNRKLSVNFQDGDGMSALHQAALQGNTDVIQLLVDSGASTELRDNKGMIPLHYATWQGKSEPVHILLQKGSTVNMRAENGETPLHLACQHGHMDVTNLLLLHHANPTSTNKEMKTPLDLACEFGRYKVVEMLLRNNLCLKMLEVNEKDLGATNQTTCLHLAARNGHVDIITLLLQLGMDINRATQSGTCLHEAALYGKIEVVKLLLDCGIDVNKPNSYDQTALDIVNKFTATRAAKELKHILKEASCACHARAIKDYHNVYDDDSLSFKEGDIITVLEQKSDGIWKGYVVQSGRMAKTGYFPGNHVVLVDSQVVAKQQLQTSSPSKRINMPPVPDLLNRSPGYMGNQHGGHFGGGGSTEDVFPPPPSPLTRSGQMDASVTENNHHPTYPPPPYSPAHHQYHGGKPLSHQHHLSGEHAGEWPGSSYTSLQPGSGDMRASSPAKDTHSPAHSNRNSAASSDSGRGVSTGHLEPKVHNLVNVHVTSQHRLSGQSYESGVSSRQSYHSTSSSSLGSLDRLEEAGYTSTINVAELMHAGVSDQEVLHAWLCDLKFEDYYDKFTNAGYDMPTISRMTPEDLTAIGITKPTHRKRLKAEIARLHIHDGIPDFKPNDLLEWLHLLGLGQYYQTLTSQGYDNIDFVTDITWEDLEEIGIQKLGHQKKIMLAIDRLKRIMSGSKRLSSVEKRRASQELLEPPPPVNNMRWSGDMAPQYVDLGMGAKPKKSPSGDSIATVSSGGSGASGSSSGSGGELKIMHLRDSELVRQNSSGSSGPDVVAIQVKRSSPRTPSSSESIPEGKDMAGQPITYQSFQSPSSEKKPGSFFDKDFSGGVPVSETNQEEERVMVAPVAPKIQSKQKPVAKIIAKTKRSSREYSPENNEVEKHESECNSDGNKNPALAGGLVLSGSLKKSQRGDEHIYDKPHLGPPPKAPKPKPGLVIPKVPVSETVSPAPTSPLRVNTQMQDSGPSTPSPTGRTKKAPPPPPKRTHSIRNEGPKEEARELPVQLPSMHQSAHYSSEVREQSRMTKSAGPPPVSSKPTKTAQASSTPQTPPQHEIPPKQQAFASCVQSLSQKFGSKREENGAQENTSSDGEEFPPPPPPIAMDIITPKIHNYGIPSKSDKAAAGEYGGLPTKIRRDLGHSPHEKRSFTSEKPEGRTFGGNLRKHMSPPKEVPQHVLQESVKIESENSRTGLSDKRSDSTTSFESTSSSSSVDSNTLPFANENVGTIKQRTPTSKPSIVEIADGMNGERNLDLNLSMFEEHSVERTSMNMVHNPNFGPGQAYGQNAVHHQLLAQGNSPSHSPSKNSVISHSQASSLVAGSRPTVTVSGMSHPAQKGVVRPPVPPQKPHRPTPQQHQQQQQLQQQHQLQHQQQQLQHHQQHQSPQHRRTSDPPPPVSAKPKQGQKSETGDVLFDIDNMLQGLTEELDAMLEEEVGC